MARPVDEKAVAALAARLTRTATDLWGPHRALDIRPSIDEMARAVWRLQTDLAPEGSQPVIHWKPRAGS